MAHSLKDFILSLKMLLQYIFANQMKNWISSLTMYWKCIFCCLRKANKDALMCHVTKINKLTRQKCEQRNWLKIYFLTTKIDFHCIRINNKEFKFIKKYYYINNFALIVIICKKSRDQKKQFHWTKQQTKDCGHTDKQTNKQTDKQTNRQTDKLSSIII